MRVIVPPKNCKPPLFPTQLITSIPRTITRPPYIKRPAILQRERNLVIKTHREVVKISSACKLASETLAYACSLVKPGISTLAISQQVHEFIIKNGAYPSPLGYSGFPEAICTSVNNVICHGIPSNSCELQDGDIVSIDVTVYKDGYHGDNCSTVIVGACDDVSILNLVRISKDAVDDVISSIGPGSMLSDIGKRISQSAKSNDLYVVGDICGHGIGKDFHELPFVHHSEYPSDGDDDLELRPGMIFTIEPAITTTLAGTELYTWNDGWTLVTVDGSPASQFEHTVHITENGVDILTRQ
eukprot:Partr_v1_DN25109_c0_g1_i2_m76937 putative Removes the N-terminal methionine from nascent proteins (By similarity)